MRGSKILDDPELINTSSKLGGSPHRGGEAEFEFPSHKHQQQHSSAKQSTKSKAGDILVDSGTPNHNSSDKKARGVRSDEKHKRKEPI